MGSEGSGSNGEDGMCLEPPGCRGPLQALVGLVGTESGCGDAFYERAGQTVRKEGERPRGAPHGVGDRELWKRAGGGGECWLAEMGDARGPGGRTRQRIPGTQEGSFEKCRRRFAQDEEKDVHPELMCEGEFGASRLLLGIGDRKRENKK